MTSSIKPSQNNSSQYIQPTPVNPPSAPSPIGVGVGPGGLTGSYKSYSVTVEPNSLGGAYNHQDTTYHARVQRTGAEIGIYGKTNCKIL